DLTGLVAEVLEHLLVLLADRVVGGGGEALLDLGAALLDVQGPDPRQLVLQQQRTLGGVEHLAGDAFEVPGELAALPDRPTPAAVEQAIELDVLADDRLE